MIKCIAIDDEPLALAQIAGYISNVPFLHQVGACQDAFEAMQLIASEDVDLFCRYQHARFKGLDFVRSLVNSPLVVFTTAYSEYAVEGFKLDAVDYLLKPFSFQDFLKSVDKARKQLEYRSGGGAADNDSNVINPDGTLFVKSDYKIIRINVNQIKYIECMSEYVRIYLEGEDKPVMTLLSMRKLEARLPASMFMRVHRSFIVKLHKIQEISRLRIIFEGNVYIPVGDNYKEKFNDYISKMCLGK
jgi:two-component system LytT family response regulator